MNRVNIGDKVIVETLALDLLTVSATSQTEWVVVSLDNEQDLVVISPADRPELSCCATRSMLKFLGNDNSS